MFEARREQILFSKPTVKDVPAICAMVDVAIERDIEKGRSPQWVQPFEPVINHAVESGEMRTVAIDGELAACIAVADRSEALWGPPVDRAWYLYSLTVATTQQGKGIPERILRTIEDEARDSSIDFIRFDVSTERTLTCAWYRRLGYRECGVVQPPGLMRPTMRFERALSTST